METTSQKIPELIAHRITEEARNQYFTDLSREIGKEHKLVSIRYICLSGLIVRIMIYDKGLETYIVRSLSCILRNEAVNYDYTIIAWKVETPSHPEMKEHCVIENGQPLMTFPLIKVNGLTGRITAFDKENRCFYYGFPGEGPEELSIEGHVFFRQFYQMLKDSPDTSLVHGACVGLNGTGVLFCAKGNGGKSTLTVLSLLKGFDYVSDDYLVISKRDGRLYADPIYSIVTLSPKMYNEMFEELEGARFISNNYNKGKYILSMAHLHDRFRTHYPIGMCMIPQIVSDSDPSIKESTPQEKGRAITNMVYSTIFQIGDTHNTMKLLIMLKDQKFYTIRLCSDIRKNVECLRSFITHHQITQSNDFQTE